MTLKTLSFLLRSSLSRKDRFGKLWRSESSSRSEERYFFELKLGLVFVGAIVEFSIIGSWKSAENKLAEAWSQKEDAIGFENDSWQIAPSRIIKWNHIRLWRTTD